MLNIFANTPHLFVAQSYAYGDEYQQAHNDYGFNLGLHVNDMPSRVLANRAKFLAMLNEQAAFEINELMWLSQVHGSDDYKVGAGRTLELPKADALISCCSHVGLCIMTADCVPIVLFSEDEQGKIGQIANVHAGWQGLAKGMIVKAVSAFGNTPIKAYIGACISGGCYEIPKALSETIVMQCHDVMSAFGLEVSLSDMYRTMVSAPNDKILFAVGELARLQLEALGVMVLNAGQACTYQENYFSHRKATHQQKAQTGRMAMVVCKS